MLARQLGVVQYGVLTVALSFASIIGYFTDLGLTQTLLREGTKPGADLPVLISSGLRLRVLFAGAVTIISVGLVSFLYSDAGLRQAIFLAALPAIWGGALLGIGTAYFTITQEMRYVAAIRMASNVLTAAAVLIVVAYRGSVQAAAFAYGSSALAGGILSLVTMRRKVPSSHEWTPAVCDGLWAFTAVGVLSTILPQIGALTLQRVPTLREVGYFGAAAKISGFLYIIPNVFAAAFYPQLFHLGARDAKVHMRLCTEELKLLATLGIMIALPLSICPAAVSRILFGANWEGGTGPVLRISAWMIVAHSVNFPIADALTTQGLQSARAVVLLSAAAAGSIAYWFLGSSFGAVGAAIAALLVEVLLFVGFSIGVPNGWSLIRDGLAIPLAAFGITTVITLVVRTSASSLLVGACSPVVFLATILAIDRSSRRRLVAVSTSLVDYGLNVLGPTSKH